jgi:hypothetical protein
VFNIDTTLTNVVGYIQLLLFSQIIIVIYVLVSYCPCLCQCYTVSHPIMLENTQISNVGQLLLVNVLPSATMGSCGGGSSIQCPSEPFMCLLSDAKQRRKTGACTILNNLLSKESFHTFQ